MVMFKSLTSILLTFSSFSDFEQEFSQVFDYNLLLPTSASSLSPHLVFLCQISTDLTLVIANEVNRGSLSGSLINVLTLFETIKSAEFRTENEFCQITLLLQRAKHEASIMSHSSREKIFRTVNQIESKWESLKTNALENIAKSESESPLPTHIESALDALIRFTRKTWMNVCLFLNSQNTSKYAQIAVNLAKEQISPFLSELEPAALKASLKSSSYLTVNRYMDDFPGLVHFFYVDRCSHQLTAPSLWTDGERFKKLEGHLDTNGSLQRMISSKIWSNFSFAKSHLAQRHFSLLWKDKTFTYSYFLWFEDLRGNPLLPDLKSKMLNSEFENIPEDRNVDCIFEDLPSPGCLAGNFYASLSKKLFGDIEKVKIFELFTIHLGVATSACVLEQTRRLAATVWEVASPLSADPMEKY